MVKKSTEKKVGIANIHMPSSPDLVYAYKIGKVERDQWVVVGKNGKVIAFNPNKHTENQKIAKRWKFDTEHKGNKIILEIFHKHSVVKVI